MGSAKIAILLDVDGTLLDIAPTPGGAIVPGILRTDLERLSRRAGGAVALVSGRTLSQIDRLFAPLRLAAIGGHGAEIRPHPDEAQLPSKTPGLNSELKEKIAAAAAKIRGLVIEDKGYSLALHYRLVPQAMPQLETLIDAAIRGQRDVEVLRGKSILEVKPSGYDKGTALRELMAYAPFARRMPVFAGDDFTDEDAFAAVADFDGLGISVGRVLPGAEAYLKSPAEVRRWIEWIATP